MFLGNEILSMFYCKYDMYIDLGIGICDSISFFNLMFTIVWTILEFLCDSQGL